MKLIKRKEEKKNAVKVVFVAHYNERWPVKWECETTHIHTHANEIQTGKQENALAQSATKIITEINFYCENARRNSEFSFFSLKFYTEIFEFYFLFFFFRLSVETDKMCADCTERFVVLNRRALYQWSVVCIRIVYCTMCSVYTSLRLSQIQINIFFRSRSHAHLNRPIQTQCETRTQLTYLF